MGQARQLAMRIADRLMTNGSGEKGERLVLWQDSKPKGFQDRGGWCRESVIREIESELLEAAVKQSEAFSRN